LPSVPANDVRTMVWLGQHYLKLHPEEDSAKRIAHALFGDESASVCSLFDCAKQRQLVLRRHAKDFRDSNVVVIDGWVLTRTEARVFALSVKESAS
jgi:hypothetical protein